MNVFFLDTRPDTAAEMHCDKHVTKMIIEYGQLLSTAHRVLDDDGVGTVLSPGPCARDALLTAD